MTWFDAAIWPGRSLQSAQTQAAEFIITDFGGIKWTHNLWVCRKMFRHIATGGWLYRERYCTTGCWATRSASSAARGSFSPWTVDCVSSQSETSLIRTSHLSELLTFVPSSSDNRGATVILDNILYSCVWYNDTTCSMDMQHYLKKCWPFEYNLEFVCVFFLLYSLKS